MRTFIITFILSAFLSDVSAQTVSNALFQEANSKTARTVYYNLSQQGTPTPIEWGFDLQWISEENLHRGINFSGKELVDIMRCGFMPSANVAGGSLSADQLNNLTTRANLVKKYCKSDVKINIADDPAGGNGVDAWYNDGAVSSIVRGQRWAKCIDLHRQKYQELGLNVLSVSPFNEPDYGWNQGNANSRAEDFMNIARSLRQDYAGVYGNPGIRICGGNTLSDDNASWWWNYSRAYLDEGNTHQLAGSFDSYANFYREVRAASHHATADELHNVMEAMVGVEYGMQTGIWWGTATRTRSLFMKATHGNDGGARLAYAENRPAWTAASVYRLPDGRVDGFVGTSERQCQPDSYRFVSLDRDVYYDGRGPMRECIVNVPGGYGYQNGQTNAETVVEITIGEDVQPYINGKYKIVNVKSGLVLGLSIPSTTGWAQITQRNYSSRVTNTNWDITPVPNTIGEDFAYYHIKFSDNTTLFWDIKNWGMNPGAEVGSFPGGGGAHIEQWYFEYAGNNNFFIKSRYSNLVVEMGGATTVIGGAIMMANQTGNNEQLWRLIPVDAVPEFVAPDAPTNLTATPQPASIRLDWTSSTSSDVRDYIILRADEGSQDFNTIGRNIIGNTFTDNTAIDGHSYTYCVKAEDKARNRSDRSNQVTASSTQERALICQMEFDDNTYDSTLEGNHGVIYGTQVWTTVHKSGTKAMSFADGLRYAQLPSTIASRNQMTISFWLRRSGTGSAVWERCFDFGNGTDQYIFLTPNAGGDVIRFEMKNKGNVETLTYNQTLSTSYWYHLTVSLDADNGTATMFINGQQVAQSTSFTVKPSDFRPVCNYVGRSQFDVDPLIRGLIDDFRIYNYAMTADEVGTLYDTSTDIQDITKENVIEENTDSYNILGQKVSSSMKGIIIRNGKKYLQK